MRFSICQEADRHLLAFRLEYGNLRKLRNIYFAEIERFWNEAIIA